MRVWKQDRQWAEQYVIARERVKQARKVLKFAQAQLKKLFDTMAENALNCDSDEDGSVKEFMPKHHWHKKERD